MVGWFWHTYTCPPPVGGTCGWQSAAYWTGDALAFTEALHSSGPEYDIAVGTDGFGVAGTLTYEFTEGTYQSRATLWIPPGSAINLHNADLASQSAASAVDGDLQFGSYSNISSGISTRAARWSGNAASMTDIHPDGFVRSWVSGAADGHAVGTAVLGATNHAILWAGGSAQVDLTPDGMAAEAVDAHGGLQVGNVGGYAAIWAGNAGSWFDLSSVLPPEYGSGRADAIEVDAEGKIVVVGSAYVPARTRSEAIVWVSGAAVTPGDANCDGFVDLDDISPFTGVLLSTDPASCHVAASDMNGDGEPDGLDIAIFVNAVLGL